MSLVSAVLITAIVHGSLLWGLMSTESRPEIRYVTLEPVVVVGSMKDSIHI